MNSDPITLHDHFRDLLIIHGNTEQVHQELLKRFELELDKVKETFDTYIEEESECSYE